MPLITYSRDIPDPPNNPSADQPDMKINNNHIDDIIDVDHFSFNDTNFSGIHKQVTMRNQSAPALGDGTGLLFTDNPFPDTFSWPFWRNAGGTELQVGPSLNQANNGYILIGAYMIQWGTSTTSSAAFPAAPTVTFTPNFSADPYVIECTVRQNSDSGFVVQVVSSSLSQFTVTTRNTNGGKVSGVTYNWVAIGLR